MHRSEDQTGGRRRNPRTTGVGTSPVLMALLALVCGIAPGFVSTRAAVAGVTPQPPMVLPSDAGTSSVGPGTDAKSWIVGGIPGGNTNRIAERAGAAPIGSRTGSFQVPRNKARALASRLKRSGRLVYAEPDVRIEPSGYPLDLLSNEQWWLNRIVSPGDVTPPQVTASSPLIALVEESLDPLHPDLVSANLTGAKSLGPDADSHGTSVAAIAGSPGEMLGIRGVWPGARMQLFPSGLKCSTASEAVENAVDEGAAVINMSYTFPAGTCFSHFLATQYAVRKGAIPIAAAGNSGASGNASFRPATDPHVISVGAVDDGGIVASFSTRDAGVDISAPGAGVLAPVVSIGHDATGNTNVIRDWSVVNGTSFAAPMVSAAAAWLVQERPGLGGLQIAGLLTGGATDLGEPGRDTSYGNGLLSIENSLTAPTPPVDPYEPNDDIRWLNGSLLGSKAPYLWRAGVGKRRVLRATLSRAKDPADVYRVMVPARRGIIVNVSQLEGNVVLTALKPKAKSISKPGKNLIVRSNRPFPKTEGIVVRNLKKKSQTIWLALTPSPATTENDLSYRIKIVRQ